MSRTFKYDVFLSYSSKDREAVHALAERLKQDGLRVWLDVWAIKPGDPIPLRIQAGLEQSRTLLMCMSPSYFGSEWGTLEHHTLIFRDPTNVKRRFVPLLIEDCTPPDIIRQFAYIDWRTPSDAAYDKILAAGQKEKEEKAKSRKRLAKSRKCIRSDQMPESAKTFTSEGSAEQWLRADEEVRKNLPPGVKLLRTLRGHTDAIGRIAWSPDGRVLASPSMDKTIRLWVTETGECQRALEGHEIGPQCVSFNLLGDILASASPDQTVRLWDTASGQQLRLLRNHKKWVHATTFAPHGSMLASAGLDDSVNLWEAETGNLLSTFDLPGERVWSLSFDSVGKILASGSSGTSGGDNYGSITFWNVDSGSLSLRQKKTATVLNCFFSIAFHPHGGILASGVDNTIEIFEEGTFRLLRTLEGHTDRVKCVAFSQDGRLLASRGDDDTIRLWDYEKGSCVAIIEDLTSKKMLLSGLAFHPQLPFLATVGQTLAPPRMSSFNPQKRTST